MENRYKVELWIKEIEEECSKSNALNFDVTSLDSLRIVSNQYEDIFSFLSLSYPAKIVNLNLKDTTLNKEIGEYLYSTSEDKRSLLFSTSDQVEQNKVLKRLVEINKTHFNNYSTNSLYITFGLLDYYDRASKKEVKSAPLVFMPIELIYNEEKDQFSIKQINKELYLNNNLITFLRKTKKLDLSFPINSKFSIAEYLSYVANKVHLLRWSVNNGVFISHFDIEKQKTLDDLITKQDKIADTSLVKSISYFNSEFYGFNDNNLPTLNKKVLTILSIDNEEYQILQKVANRESLFIRCDSLENKYHLMNASIASFLLNNKKTLITYNSFEEKEEFIKNLNPVLKPYFIDLSKEKVNKTILIDRLNKFDTDYLTKDTLDSTTSQEILNKFYETKNSFKMVINSLRKKVSPFNYSVSDLIEKYYSLENDMLSLEIPYINNLTSETLNEYLESIYDFVNINKKLGCYYKDHPFYGFKKSSIMQEEFFPLKIATLKLSEDLKQLIDINKSLNEEFNIPYINNLKLSKALLNILSVLDVYNDHNPDFFEKESWNEVYENLARIASKKDDISKLEKEIKDDFGSNVFNVPSSYIERVESNKKLSKREVKALRPYFSSDKTITLDTLKEFYKRNEEISDIEFEIENIRQRIPECFFEFIKNDVLDVERTNKLEEACHIIRKSMNYLHKYNVGLSYSHLKELKDKNKISPILDLRKNMQILFNKILNNTEILQVYFDVDIFDFARLDLETYLEKTETISKNFIKINDYLDFLLSLWKTNHVIKGLGNALLVEKDYTLYEKMFFKRFYHDYAMHLMNIDLNKKMTAKSVFEHLKNYDSLDENRIKLFNSIVRNNYIESLRTQSIILKRYEKNYLDEEKNNASFMPLSKITNMAHESIYHKIPILLVPLKDVSALLNSEQYHFDANIILSDRNMLTKDTLASLYRGEQTLVFDNQLISSDHETDYIDIYEIEKFVNAAKRAYTNIELVSKTYKNIPLQINRRDLYFKNHIYKKLIESGFEVAKDVVIKDLSIDFVCRMPSRKGLTCLIINRLPYYSIESAKESINANREELEKLGYYSINIFPFAYFKDEENEFNKLKQEIIDNSFKSPAQKVKTVKRKLSDILFEEYVSPREFFYGINNKNSYSRRELFYMVLNNTCPVLKSEMLSLFPLDGELYLSILQKENKINIKDGFIYLANKDIEFKSYKNKIDRYRKVETVAKEEIEEGIIRIVKYTKSIEDSILIPMILNSLGYKTMNSSNYEAIENILIDLVKRNKLILEEGNVSINEEYQEVEQVEEVKEEEIKLIVRDE